MGYFISNRLSVARIAPRRKRRMYERRNKRRGAKVGKACRAGVRGRLLCVFGKCLLAGNIRFPGLPAYFASVRQMKVTIWALVQLALGLKVVSLVPVVMLLATAHITASP